jgi:hypothetical protein
VERGWVKLWRRAEDADVFADANLWHLWTWCLLQATHKPHAVPVRTGRGQTTITLKPGQFIFGRHTAAKA